VILGTGFSRFFAGVLRAEVRAVHRVVGELSFLSQSFATCAQVPDEDQDKQRELKLKWRGSQINWG